MDGPFGYDEFERTRRGPPDQDQRLGRDPHHLGRSRRPRPWIAVAIGVVVIAAFLAIMATGGGVNSEIPDDGYVVDTP